MQVAIDHHLVSAYTSLVAVDVTPTNTTGVVRTAMVASTLPSGMALPQTDTPATLQFVMGLAALLAAASVAAVGRMRTSAA